MARKQMNEIIPSPYEQRQIAFLKESEEALRVLCIKSKRRFNPYEDHENSYHDDVVDQVALIVDRLRFSASDAHFYLKGYQQIITSSYELPMEIWQKIIHHFIDDLNLDRELSSSAGGKRALNGIFKLRCVCAGFNSLVTQRLLNKRDGIFHIRIDESVYLRTERHLCHKSLLNRCPLIFMLLHLLRCRYNNIIATDVDQDSVFRINDHQIKLLAPQISPEMIHLFLRVLEPRVPRGRFTFGTQERLANVVFEHFEAGIVRDLLLRNLIDFPAKLNWFFCRRISSGLMNALMDSREKDQLAFPDIFFKEMLSLMNISVSTISVLHRIPIKYFHKLIFNYERDLIIAISERTNAQFDTFQVNHFMPFVCSENDPASFEALLATTTLSHQHQFPVCKMREIFNIANIVSYDRIYDSSSFFTSEETYDGAIRHFLVDDLSEIYRVFSVSDVDRFPTLSYFLRIIPNVIKTLQIVPHHRKRWKQIRSIVQNHQSHLSACASCSKNKICF